MSDELKLDLTGIVEEDDGEDQDEADDRSPSLLAGLLAPVAGITAKLAGPLSPALRVFTLVPLPILSAVGSALGVVLLVLIVTTVTGSGRATADAKEATDSHAAVTHEEEHDEEPIIRTLARNNVPTGTPQPTATSTPVPFQSTGNGSLTAIGRPGAPDLGGRIPADNLYQLDRPIVRGFRTNFSVLVRSGSSSPVFGVLLAYEDEANHLGIRFVTDDYDQSRPAVALVQVKNGKPTTIGEGKPVGNLAFWGRDSYELRVAVTPQEIRAWLNGRTLARWPNPGLPPDARSGLFLLGPSRMRFDAIVVE